jgi:hypothetical protein
MRFSAFPSPLKMRHFLGQGTELNMAENPLSHDTPPDHLQSPNQDYLDPQQTYRPLGL